MNPLLDNYRPPSGKTILRKNIDSTLGFHFAKNTPEEWIKHFYNILVFDDGQFDIIDNSKMIAQETAETILNLMKGKKE